MIGSAACPMTSWSTFSTGSMFAPLREPVSSRDGGVSFLPWSHSLQSVLGTSCRQKLKPAFPKLKLFGGPLQLWPKIRPMQQCPMLNWFGGPVQLLPKPWLTVANTAVAKMIKSILARRDPGGWPIRLSMTFYLRDGVPISVGHTVGNAMATLKVEKAEFTVLTEKKGRKCSIDDVVNYGTRFVSFFNECHNAFAGLTRLYLENLRFRESNFVSNILVTCKQLNYLGFFNCDTEDWITLQVEHAQLIELSIVNCRFDMVKLTWVPKLTCLVFLFWLTSREPPLALGYVPLLEVLRLSNAARSLDKMLKLSTFLHETSVRDLTLGFQCEKVSYLGSTRVFDQK
uniref:Uncharacterized protein n=1 Tax=Aegilops tauschii subsp. strangulata TaxID=200361 RepID=A0A453Q5Q6_AEGTS